MAKLASEPIISKPRQSEFALAVTVCAWCKPKANSLAPALAVLSHGICPRHLRQMRSKALGKTARGK